MKKQDELISLRKDVLGLQDAHLDLLLTENGETALELAFGSFLYRIDQEIRAMEDKKAKKRKK